MTKGQRETIEVVSMDRGGAYFSTVKEHLPHASICFDHFHIIMNINDALTEVRRTESKKYAQNRSVIQGSRYLLLSAKENLTDEQKGSLDKVLEVNRNIQVAYLLKEHIRELYSSMTLSEAHNAFILWFKLVAESELKPFKRLAKSFKRHLPEILNYFTYRLTSGRIEGLNARISRIQHKCRGITTLRYLYLRLRLLTSPTFAPLLK